MARVRASYNELNDASRRFAAQSEAIAASLNQVKNSMAPLEGGGWIGEAASSFYNEMNGDVLPAVDRLRNALEVAGQITQQIANTLKQAEQQASGLFK